MKKPGISSSGQSLEESNIYLFMEHFESETVKPVIDFILRKNPKKKFSEFYRLPLQSGFAGSPNFSKKTFFSYFSKTKSF